MLLVILGSTWDGYESMIDGVDEQMMERMLLSTVSVSNWTSALSRAMSSLQCRLLSAIAPSTPPI